MSEKDFITNICYKIAEYWRSALIWGKYTNIYFNIGLDENCAILSFTCKSPIFLKSVSLLCFTAHQLQLCITAHHFVPSHQSPRCIIAHLSLLCIKDNKVWLKKIFLQTPLYLLILPPSLSSLWLIHWLPWLPLPWCHSIAWSQPLNASQCILTQTQSFIM